MKKAIKTTLAALTLALLPASASATATGIHITSLSGTPSSAGDVIDKLVKLLLTAAGTISVIMIIIGGIMYALSAGDSGKGTKAKDTILYSVIGLVITMLAYGIVTFVVGWFK